MTRATESPPKPESKMPIGLSTASMELAFSSGSTSESIGDGGPIGSIGNGLCEESVCGGMIQLMQVLVKRGAVFEGVHWSFNRHYRRYACSRQGIEKQAFSHHTNAHSLGREFLRTLEKMVPGEDFELRFRCIVTLKPSRSAWRIAARVRHRSAEYGLNRLTSDDAVTQD